MLNIEKYKEEILKEYNKRLENTDEGRYSEQLANAIFDVFCCDKYKREKENVAEWAFREYEEPNSILTKEGKEFLRMMIADFNIYDIEYILKEEDENKVNNYLMINLRNGHVTTIYEKNSKECMLLKNMGNRQRYTAKELGL